MPRLPDANALGERRIAESGRPMAQWDTGAPTRALEGFGQSISRVGATVNRFAESQDNDALRLGLQKGAAPGD